MWKKLWNWLRNFEIVGSISSTIGLTYAGLLAGMTVIWAFLQEIPGPIILAIAAVVCAAVFAAMYYSSRLAEKEKKPDSSEASAQEWNETQTPIHDQHYLNEAVEVDGKMFVDCSFANVTLVYRGTGDTTFIRSRCSGTLGLRTSNRAARGFASLTAMLKSTPNIELTTEGTADDKGCLKPGYKLTSQTGEPQKSGASSDDSNQDDNDGER